MISIDEFGCWKCVMNLYVKDWKNWMNCDFGGKFTCFVYFMYILYMGGRNDYDMFPNGIIMILISMLRLNWKYEVENGSYDTMLER